MNKPMSCFIPGDPGGGCEGTEWRRCKECQEFAVDIPIEAYYSGALSLMPDWQLTKARAFFGQSDVQVISKMTSFWDARLKATADRFCFPNTITMCIFLSALTNDSVAVVDAVLSTTTL